MGCMAVRGGDLGEEVDPGGIEPLVGNGHLFRDFCGHLPLCVLFLPSQKCLHVLF